MESNYCPNYVQVCTQYPDHIKNNILLPHTGLSVRVVTHNTCYDWVCLIFPWCSGQNCLLLIVTSMLQVPNWRLQVTQNLMAALLIHNNIIVWWRLLKVTRLPLLLLLCLKTWGVEVYCWPSLSNNTRHLNWVRTSNRKQNYSLRQTWINNFLAHI